MSITVEKNLHLSGGTRLYKGPSKPVYIHFQSRPIDKETTMNITGDNLASGNYKKKGMPFSQKIAVFLNSCIF